MSCLLVTLAIVSTPRKEIKGKIPKAEAWRVKGNCKKVIPKMFPASVWRLNQA